MPSGIIIESTLISDVDSTLKLLVMSDIYSMLKKQPRSTQNQPFFNIELPSEKSIGSTLISDVDSALKLLVMSDIE